MGLGKDARFSPQRYLKPEASNNSHFIVSHNSVGVLCPPESCGAELAVIWDLCEQKHWRWVVTQLLVPPQGWVHRDWMAGSLLFPPTLRTAPSHASIDSLRCSSVPQSPKGAAAWEDFVSDCHPIGPSLCHIVLSTVGGRWTRVQGAWEPHRSGDVRRHAHWRPSVKTNTLDYVHSF